MGGRAAHVDDFTPPKNGSACSSDVRPVSPKGPADWPQVVRCGDKGFGRAVQTQVSACKPGITQLARVHTLLLSNIASLDTLQMAMSDIHDPGPCRLPILRRLTIRYREDDVGSPFSNHTLETCTLPALGRGRGHKKTLSNPQYFWVETPSLPVMRINKSSRES